MADLLLELFSEEIPARMQAEGASALAKIICRALNDGAVPVPDGKVQAFSTPRRLGISITGLAKAGITIVDEQRGPKVGAPDQAIEGFLKKAGFSRDALYEIDGYYYVKMETKGLATAEVLQKNLPELLTKFPWPKSMRWGAGSFRWVRPLHSILCILDSQIVPFEVDGIKSGNTTQGHRFMSKGVFSVSSFDEYKAKLKKEKVVLSTNERISIVVSGLKKLHKEQGFTYDITGNLVNEVAGLVEWPVLLVGSFDKNFLEIPEEALISEMRHHQKYFHLKDQRNVKLSNKFAFVANMEASDKGKEIVAGNERVLSARLFDAKFFWDQDRKVSLEDRLPKLKDIVFHEKLGTVAERSGRIEKLAGEIAAFVPGCDAAKAMRAAKLAKADLVSGMVGEFPDLQGVMGGYYAKAEGEGEDIANAIRDQYSPKGPGDACPSAPVSVALALANKIEILTSMFGIGEKPTGSKDPYALRRAALGSIRLIVENNLRIRLQHEHGISDDLMAFFADRLKVQQKEKGVRHDLIDAVFSLGHEDDLVRILARVSALQNFLKTKDGENLLSGHKRAVNILRIEERKDGNIYSKKIDPKLLKDKEEIALERALQVARRAIDQALMEEDFEGAMTAVAALRKPIDAFFDNVTVNTDEQEGKLRENRLRLLAGIRKALMPIADFSKIEG